ncbi:MAG: RnfABCDGE type electron transport complex subunit B [Clostridiaceae bacterium]|nr:RnfABCDGE type electron transport complex subunit B [Clostridiaceae bacterium]
MLTVSVLISWTSILLPIGLCGGIALILGVFIVVTSRIFALPVDEHYEKIRAALPGANCGACGYSGCDAYATALNEKEESNPGKCPVGGKDTALELSGMLGLTPPSFIPQVAHVFCQGNVDNTQKRYAYSGTISCDAAQGLFSGPNSCTYGCIGFGDCVAACPYHALYLAGGIAHVDSSRCKACGLCVKTCPKSLIAIIPKHYQAYTVSCRNKWPGAQTRKNCKTGCIGCGRCHQVCPAGAITLDGPLASIDQLLCTHCGKCLEVCPTHAICHGLLLGQDENGLIRRTSDQAAMTGKITS